MKNLLLTLLLLPALAAAKVPVEEDIVAKTSDPDSPFYYTSLMSADNAGDEDAHPDEDYSTTSTTATPTRRATNRWRRTPTWTSC